MNTDLKYLISSIEEIKAKTDKIYDIFFKNEFPIKQYTILNNDEINLINKNVLFFLNNKSKLQNGNNLHKQKMQPEINR